MKRTKSLMVIGCILVAIFGILLIVNIANLIQLDLNGLFIAIENFGSYSPEVRQVILNDLSSFRNSTFALIWQGVPVFMGIILILMTRMRNQ